MQKKNPPDGGLDTATPNHRNPQDPAGLKATARIPALDAFVL